MQSKIELMAPVGSYESLAAAIKAGADSIYFGIEQLNMRARSANNFSIKDLKKIAKTCNEKGIRSYLTVNTILYDNDLELMKKICNTAKEAGITAIIAHDIAVICYANSIGLEVHMSTQANISNIEGVKFYSQYADVIVLARELTLEQIKHIGGQIKQQNITGPSGRPISIELFAHGAMCVSIAGKCYMSLATYNQSANRGLCLQNCRRAYKVTDIETGDELVINNNYVMSPKDLCTIGILDKLADAGATVLKIEGRARKADYVYTTVKSYREAIDSIIAGAYTKDKISQWTKQLESVYNRGFWHGGYYAGKKLGEWSGTYGSKATKEKIYLGIAKNYYAKNKVGLFQLESGEVKIGDDILITGPTTGVIQTKVENIYLDNNPKESAKKGQEITIPLPDKIRKNDKLFLVVERKNIQKKQKIPGF